MAHSDWVSLTIPVHRETETINTCTQESTKPHTLQWTHRNTSISELNTATDVKSPFSPAAVMKRQRHRTERAQIQEQHGGRRVTDGSARVDQNRQASTYHIPS